MLRGVPWIDHELDVAVEEMQKGNELAEALAGVGGVEQSIELRNGGAEPTGELAPTRARLLRPSPSLDGEFVDQDVSGVA
jgi:hypothetical protein